MQTSKNAEARSNVVAVSTTVHTDQNASARILDVGKFYRMPITIKYKF